MKLRLTENQYLRLKQRLFEFSQDETNQIFVIGNSVIFHIKDDTGTHAVKMVVVKNPKNNKEVPNVFYTKLVSEWPMNLRNCYLEISQPGQNIANSFTVVNLGKVNDNGDLTQKPVKYTFKNIFKVDAKNKNGQLIGSYFAQEHDQEKNKQDKYVEKASSEKSKLLQMLNSLNSSDIIKLIVPTGEIALSFLDKQGDIIQFEVENKNGLPQNYESFKKLSSLEININNKEVEYNAKTNGVTLKTTGHWPVDGQMQHETGEIKDITDGEIIDDTESGDDEEGNTSSKNAKEIMKAIINDPLMKQAFYSQPTLWNLITSAIKGENPRGTGIIPAMNIVRNYVNLKIKKDLGPSADSFIPNVTARFKIIGSNVFSNPTGRQADRLDLKVGDSYKAVYREKLENTNIILNCGLLKAQIIILSEIPGVENAFNVVFVKEIEGKNGVTTKKTNGKIQFVSQKGTGYYNNPEGKEQPQTNTPPTQ